VILNFEAQAEGMTTDQVLLDILQTVSEKSDDAVVAAVVARR
jgi:MoxR-like ATPase